MGYTKGIFSDKAPSAIGPYSPALQIGDFVYLSGQLGIDRATGNLVEGGVKEQADQAMKNLEYVLAEMGMGMRHIVKTTIFLKDLADFATVNEVYGSYFREPYPARSCFQVAALPKGGLVEIEAFAIDTTRLEMMDQMRGGCDGGCCGGDDCGEGCGCEGCGD